MQLFFLKLLAAHIAADFLLQNKYIVAHKARKRIQSIWLYAHALLHAILTALLLQEISRMYIYIYILIFTSHLLIDIVKIYYLSGFRGFLIDQSLHVSVIAVLTLLLFPKEAIHLKESLDTHTLLSLFVSLSLNTYVACIAIGIFMQRWRLGALNHSSLPQAGAYIGILERLLIFLFINLNFYAAIGFLLAAKSVFRFGDLSKSKDRKLTEYILVGTLVSFVWGILSALLLKCL
ncbi:MAG: membrane protein [Thermonema sp.]|uniref:DUF3307 domain-containing protein n=1 Tax=Thermonema sp. TaxID=2231181 RepID=UPI0021DD0516|nr:DUF3307 domain-containing protein [Thermonema sp.]GIV38554.1 MAG: membrane protein [Thermonema sp.]